MPFHLFIPQFSVCILYKFLDLVFCCENMKQFFTDSKTLYFIFLIQAVHPSKFKIIIGKKINRFLFILEQTNFENTKFNH